MAETVVNYFVNLFGDKIPPEFTVFFISMLPIVELRGGMIAAKLLDVDFFRAFALCYIANILPIPFVLLFIRRFLSFCRRHEILTGFVDRLEKHSIKKSEKIKQVRAELGLLILVAVPLPGTGGWTGALVASLTGMKNRLSFVVIAIGVLIANIIMSVITYALPEMLGA